MGMAGCIGLSDGALARSLASLRLEAKGGVRTEAFDGVQLGVCDASSMAENDIGVALFDGRIDNRADLDRDLGLSGECRPAMVVLAAYERWGEAFCERIIGDYACALWETRRRRLLLATDPGALRTLFFWASGERLLFATEQRGLWAVAEVPRELDREQMAAWLSMLPREPLRTFFRGVQRVPPGHSVIWDGGRFQVDRWWRPENLPELRLRHDQEYADALRASLEEAVRCRIGPGEVMGSELSGGLDSSAVTALAARKLATEGRTLTSFTAAPRHAAPAQKARFVDEWPHAALTAAQYPNIDHVRIDNDATPLLDTLALRELGNDWPVLNASSNVWGTAIDRAARDRNVRVMLNGWMGNLTVSYDGGGLIAGRVGRGDALGSLRAIPLLRRAGWSWLAIASEMMRGMVPGRTHRALRSLLGRNEPGLLDYSAVRPDFLRGLGIEDRAMSVACNLQNVAGSDSRALRLAALDRTDHRGHWMMGTRRLFGIDVRDPTSDRRVIELSLSIPEEQFIKDGVPRSLMRRAMRGIVPDVILDERRRGLQAADWRVGFHAALPELRNEVARLRASPFASECLDLDRMDALLDAWPGPGDTSTAASLAYVCAFSRGLTAGRFIRRIEGGNA